MYFYLISLVLGIIFAIWASFGTPRRIFLLNFVIAASMGTMASGLMIAWFIFMPFGQAFPMYAHTLVRGVENHIELHARGHGKFYRQYYLLTTGEGERIRVSSRDVRCVAADDAVSTLVYTHYEYTEMSKNFVPFDADSFRPDTYELRLTKDTKVVDVVDQD